MNLPFKKNHGFMKRNLSLWYDQIFHDESIKDKEIINYANKAKIKMLFTGIRHFYH